MEMIQKFLLVTIMLMDSGNIDTSAIVLAQCPDKQQYYAYMEARMNDDDEDIDDWRATCIPFVFEKKPRV